MPSGICRENRRDPPGMEDRREEEKEYVLNNRNTKNIIGCPNKQYGENLKYLMTEGLVLRFGLWVM